MGSRLRIIVPLAILVVGVLVVFATFRTSQRGTGAPATSEGPTGTEPYATPTPDPDDADLAQTRSDQPGEPDEGPALDAPLGEEAQAESLVDAEWLSGLRFEPQSTEALGALGELDATDADELRLEFSPWGAGIQAAELGDYYDSLQRTPENRYKLLEGIPQRRPALSMRAVWIDGRRIDAQARLNEDGQVVADLWRRTGPGTFEARIVDAQGQPVLTIRREFRFLDAPYGVSVRQAAENHTDRTLELVIEQWGPSDLPYKAGGYGDYRRVRFGYLDPRSQRAVLSQEGDFLLQRSNVISDGVKNDDHLLWPNDTSRSENFALAWVATTNRYFGFAVFPHLSSPSPDAPKEFRTVERVEFYLESRGEQSLSQIDPAEAQTRYMNLKFVSPAMTVEPGAAVDFSVDAYLGPLREPILAQAEPYRWFNLRELVVYQLGCAWCTFQWLAHLLLWFLRLIEGDIVRIAGVGLGVHDWAVAIIILVFCVRALLHPLTKRSQVSMARMGRKMAKLKPELDRLREKFGDDPRRMQQEQLRLYREHNVNPAGGCLAIMPMFLQTPIWVALYAVLYFAIELRQEPAFYGLFQMFGHWPFLADLSQPDHFIPLPRPIDLPSILPVITGINLLPVLLGVVFFIQQKYMTPPATNLTPEQETQQKITRVMMIVLFPLFLYNAPAGLCLYIITSSTVGILESRYVRAHIEEIEKREAERGHHAGGGAMEGFRRQVINRAQGRRELPGGRRPKKR